MCSLIPSTFSLSLWSFSLTVWVSIAENADGLICPQPTFIFLQGSPTPLLQHRQVVTQVFPSSWLPFTFPSGSAKEIHIVVRRQGCPLSRSEPRHMSQYSQERSVSFGRPYTKLCPQIPVWLYVSRTRRNDQCQFPSRLVPNVSPLWHSIRRCNIVSSSPHTLHLEVSVRLILCRRSLVGRSWITRNHRVTFILHRPLPRRAIVTFKATRTNTARWSERSSYYRFRSTFASQ
jgi:hypothetical protein